MNKAQWYFKLTAENYRHRNPFATIQQETLKKKKYISSYKAFGSRGELAACIANPETYCGRWEGFWINTY